MTDTTSTLNGSPEAVWIFPDDAPQLYYKAEPVGSVKYVRADLFPSEVPSQTLNQERASKAFFEWREQLCESNPDMPHSYDDWERASFEAGYNVASNESREIRLTNQGPASPVGEEAKPVTGPTDGSTRQADVSSGTLPMREAVAIDYVQVVLDSLEGMKHPGYTKEYMPGLTPNSMKRLNETIAHDNETVDQCISRVRMYLIPRNSNSAEGGS